MRILNSTPSVLLRSLNILLFLVIIFSFGSSWAKKKIDLSNFSLKIQNEIYQAFPNVKNEAVSLSVVDDIMRFLQSKSEFDRIQAFDIDSTYKITYFRSKKIGEIHFFGSSFLSKSDLEKIFSIQSSEPFDQTKIIEEAEKLRQFYKDKGFFNCLIDIELPPNQQNLEDIDVDTKITEGKRSLVHKINIQSSNIELNKKLTSLLEYKIGEPLIDKTLADINRKLRDYLTDERYVRAEILGPNLTYNSDQSEVTLNYRIEKAENYIFEFNGIKIQRSLDLKNALALDNYYTNSSSVGTDLSQKIKNYCVGEGYAQAEVTFEEKDFRPPFQKTIAFKINEGPRIKIENVIINGNLSRKPSYYINFIKDHSSPIIADGFFNKEDIETGLRNLNLQLQNEGYLQSKITSTRIQYNREKTKITLFINMEEGPLTIIKKIEFSGNVTYSQDELLKVTEIRPGPLKLNQIETAVLNIKSHYRENGYIEMLLLNEKEDLVTYDESSTQALLHFKILEGPQVRTASIIIEGNNFTKNYVVLNEIELHPGELITPQKIENSILHLQRSGLFSAVEVRTLEDKTNVANRTVLVKVTERDPGLFTVGLGATNERKLTLRGSTSVAYRNLWGTGRGLSLRLEGNYNVAEFQYLESKVVLGYLEPYLFNSRMRGRANITLSSLISNYQIKQVTDINSYTYSFENDLSNHILGTWDVWSLAQVKDSGLDSSYPYAPEQQDIATTGPNIDIDYRDNPFNPTSGHFTRINAEYADPSIGSSATINYWKAVVSFSHYKNIGSFFKQPMIWANQIRGAYLKNLSNLPDSNNGVPWEKKGFSLGGTSTVRGYEAGTEYFPNNKDLGIAGSNKKYYLESSSSMFLVKSELRIPIKGSLGTALFYDGGQVLIEGLDIKESYRASAGLGLRYNTPVGPLSFDLAWKLNMQADESPWRLHISIGTY